MSAWSLRSASWRISTDNVTGVSVLVKGRECQCWETGSCDRYTAFSDLCNDYYKMLYIRLYYNWEATVFGDAVYGLWIQKDVESLMCG